MPTKISWADETWNLIIGCSKISAGCVNCYAEKEARRQVGFGTKGYDLAMTSMPHKGKFRFVWSGDAVFQEHILTKPLHWKQPRKIFVVSMGDLFHESVPFEWIDRVFAVMALCPQHQFMCLTKRAGRMQEYITGADRDWEYSDGLRRRIVNATSGLTAGFGEGSQAKLEERMMYDRFTQDYDGTQWPLPNVHLGVTVENQDNVGRIADLIRTPAAKRFVSFEPLLEKVGHIHEVIVTCSGCGQKSLVNMDISDGVRDDSVTACFKCMEHRDITTRLDYAFIGCESGPGARLCSPDDIRYVMQQCALAGIKRHIKQIPLNGRCNKNIDEWPDEFRVREV